MYGFSLYLFDASSSKGKMLLKYNIKIPRWDFGYRANFSKMSTLSGAMSMNLVRAVSKFSQSVYTNKQYLLWWHILFCLSSSLFVTVRTAEKGPVVTLNKGIKRWHLTYLTTPNSCHKAQALWAGFLLCSHQCQMGCSSTAALLYYRISYIAHCISPK